MARRSSAATTLLLLAMAVPAQAQDREKASGALTHDVRVQTFAQLWQEVNYNFAYFDNVPTLDWSARFTAYLPQVQAAGSTFEYYRVLQRFFAELKDGHTLVFFPDSIVQRRPIDMPAVELEEIGHRALVANVDSSLAAALPLGSEIVRVDSLTVPQQLEQFVFPIMAVSTEHVRWRDAIRGNARHMYGLLAGAAGSSVSITAITPAGKTVRLTLPRDRGSRPPRWLIQRTRRDLLEHRPLAHGLDYVAINSFNKQALVTRFDSLMPRLTRSRGVVLDLRRNGGGIDDVVRKMLTRLTADTLLGPAWRTRTHNATFKAWGRFADEDEWARQYRPYWNGEGVWYTSAPDTVYPDAVARITAPIVVLISSETASAAENFLIYIHKRNRFTIVGQPSNGSSGQPLMLDLPGGGRAWICTKRNTYPDGRTYIGTGVLPDVAVPVSVDDVRAGRDRALEKAIELLRR